MAHGTCCRCEHVAHARLWSSGGCDNLLDEYFTWPTELVAAVYKKRYSWAYSWTWRHNVALIRHVGFCGRGVTESTLALRLREEKKDMDGWMFAWGT